MRKLIIGIAAALCASALFAASPAATQAWVMQYVATHGGGGGGGTTNGVTAAWVEDYVRTNMVKTAASAAQDERKSLIRRMKNQLAMALLETSRSGLHALSFAYKDSSNSLHSVKLADRDGGGWTNVVRGCGISTNTENEAVLVLDSLDYTCPTFDYKGRNIFTRIDGSVTNNIYVGYSSITTNDYKTARGEN